MRFFERGDVRGLIWLIITGSQATSEDAFSHLKPSHPSGKLYIYPWKIYPDMAVFDWYIRLSEKDRLIGCDLSYGPENGGNISTAENFLPPYRTFKIQPLSSNTSYWVYMVCRDKEGGWHASDTLNFTAGTRVLAEPKLAAIHIPVKESNLQSGRLNRGMLSIRPTKRMSPHLLMGISCTILSLVVLSISSVLVVKRYQAADRSFEDVLDREGSVVKENDDISSEMIKTSKDDCYVDIDSYIETEDGNPDNSDDCQEMIEEESENMKRF